MSPWTFAVLLMAVAAGSAPVPVAPVEAGDDTISDRGEGYRRSGDDAAPVPKPAEAAPASGPAVPTATAAGSFSSGSTPRVVAEEARNAPGTGRLVHGRGGHDHVERRGRGLIIDGEGRRLEILPVKNRFVETPPLPKAADDMDAVLSRLRALTVVGVSLTLLLTGWLWRRKDA